MDHDIPALIERHGTVFSTIGAVVIAGAHVEILLQIFLTKLQGHELPVRVHPEVARMQWTDLEKELRRMANEPGPLSGALSDLLDWSATNSLAATRNNVIHTAWGLVDPGEMAGGRWFRNGSTGTVITDAPALQQVAAMFFDYADRIFELTPLPRWSNRWGPVPYWFDWGE